MDRRDVEQKIDEELVRSYVSNYDEDVEPWPMKRQFVPKTVPAALAAGAEPPLEFVGMGMTGTVFCDRKHHAYKVASRDDFSVLSRISNSKLLADEAEWLATAKRVPAVREHVADFIAWHPKEGVIERECVRVADVPARRWRSHLWELHGFIGDAMKPFGWGRPEFKKDSYVFTDDRGPVLVDAGFVNRYGDRLAEYVRDVLDGRRPWGNDRPEDLALALRMDNPEPRGEAVDVLLWRLNAECER